MFLRGLEARDIAERKDYQTELANGGLVVSDLSVVCNDTLSLCHGREGFGSEAALSTPKLNKSPIADELCFCQVTDTGNILSSAIKHICKHKHISRTSSQSIGIFPRTLARAVWTFSYC